MNFELTNLALTRPLAAIDLETTGTDPATDLVVEVAVLRVSPDGHCESYCRRVNPGVPIPPAATAVHDIRDADVAGAPRFAEVAGELAGFLGGCDLAGFGVASFDLPLLTAEFARAGVRFRVTGRRVLDALAVYRRMEPRDLSSAVRLYLRRDHAGAHSALADVRAALEVLDAQVGRYGLPGTADGLHAELSNLDAAGRFRLDDAGRPSFAFGKYKGRTLGDVAASDPGYLRWMLGQSFLDDALELVQKALAAPGGWE